MDLDRVTEEVIRQLEGRPIADINERVTLSPCTGDYEVRVVQLVDTPIGRRVRVEILGGHVDYQDITGEVTCYFPCAYLEVPESWIRRLPA